MQKILTLLSLFLCVGLSGQTSSTKQSPALVDGMPESQGMSQERLTKIDAMLQQTILANELPGAVVLIARNGKIIFHKAYGMADGKSKKAMDKDAIFRIASQTKAITSTAVLMLWEEGKFKLDDPISKYIPEFG